VLVVLFVFLWGWGFGVLLGPRGVWWFSYLGVVCLWGFLFVMGGGAVVGGFWRLAAKKRERQLFEVFFCVVGLWGGRGSFWGGGVGFLVGRGTAVVVPRLSPGNKQLGKVRSPIDRS